MCIGLGLAVVARIVEQLGGQLRVDSKPNEGSRFSFLIPFTVFDENGSQLQLLTSPDPLGKRPIQNFRSKSSSSSEIEDIVEALATNPLKGGIHNMRREKSSSPNSSRHSLSPPRDGKFEITDSAYPLKSIKLDSYDVDSSAPLRTRVRSNVTSASLLSSVNDRIITSSGSSLRILIVEVSFISIVTEIGLL